MAAIMRGRRGVAILGSAIVLALVGGTVAVAGARTPAAPNLPPIAPQDLLTSTLHTLSLDPSVSGDALVHVDLGLPQLPTGEGEPPVTGPLSALSALSGDHTLRVWRSKDGVRVADILPAAERAVFATRNALWLWDSTDLTAYHVVGPGARRGSPAGDHLQPDPTSLAAAFLRAVSPSTMVSVGDPTTVAGEPVYPLLLEPRAAGTLVGRVEIDVDANTWVPLRVAVLPRGTDSPSIEAGFTRVSFDPIDPATFDFEPPPGSTVKTVTLPAPHDGSRPDQGAAPASGDVRTFGGAWTEIVAVQVPSATETKDPALAVLAGFLPYAGPLVSIDLVVRGDHRWVVAGMVPPGALAAVEPQLP